MEKIGFIGLGNMGMPMAQNLLQTGFNVTGFDLSPQARIKFETIGGDVADSLADLADSDVIFTSLQTGEQVESVCLGSEGLFQAVKPGTLFIDTSSIDIETSRRCSQTAIESGLAMVDTPVSGGVAGAIAASLTIMVGGREEDFTRSQPILQHLGKNIIHAGDLGSGQAAKICNNMILGISMIAVSEAFLLAEKLGLAPEKLFQISSQASGQCWSMTSYSPYPGLVENVPSNNDYQPGFTAQMMLKDLKLSQQASGLVSQQTPLGQHATDLYQQFVDQGSQGVDFSGIIKLLRG